MKKHKLGAGSSARSYRRTSLIAAFVLFASLLASPATATPAPTGHVSKSTAAPDPVETARQEAKRQNKQVEIETLNTEDSTTVANPDGKTLGTYVYSAPVRVKKDGVWKAIDTTLVEENGIVRPRVSKLDVTLSAGGDTSLAKAGTAKGETAVGAPNKLPKPELSGSSATYPSAYGQGVDLVVSVTATGLRQEIVIRQRPTGRLDFRLPVKLPKGVAYGKDSSGKPTLPAADHDGRAVPLAPALLLDSTVTSPTATPGDGRMRTVPATVNKTAKGSELVFAPDPAFLGDPKVTYPVTLALDSTPWYGPGMPSDTFINDGTWSEGGPHQYMDSLVAGRSRDATWRSYIRFNLADAPFFGRPILNADMRPWNYRSHACGSDVGDIVVRRITSDWTMNTLRWSNQPAVTTVGQGTKGSGVGRNDANQPCSAPAQEIYYSIEGIVRDWANGEPNYGLQVRAVNENVLNYREYLSAEWAGTSGRGPVIFVEYESPPQTVEVSTFQYGEFTATPEQLNEMHSRQTDVDDPPFLNPSDDESRDAALNSSAHVIVDAGGLQPPSDLTQEEVEWEANDDGPGYEESEDLPSSEPDTAPPGVFSSPAANEYDVPADVKIRAAFTEPVTDAIFALKDSVGSDTAITVTPTGEDGQGWELVPEQSLQAGATYSIQIKAAKDTTGNVVDDYVAPFTVKGSETTPTPTPTPTRTYDPLCARSPAWSGGTTYSTGTYVTHNDYAWEALQLALGVSRGEPGVDSRGWASRGYCYSSIRPGPPVSPAPSTRKSQDGSLAAAGDDARVDECWRNKAVASDPQQDGYLAGRLNWCAIHQLVEGDLQFGTRNIVNGITADATIIGFTSPSGKGNTGQRYTDFRISLRNVNPIGGVYAQKAYIAFGASVKVGCRVGGDAYQQARWQDWRDGKTADFRIVSDEAHGQGDDKIEWCHPRFYSKVWLPSIPSTPVKYSWAQAKPQARCDSASYIASTRGGGCVFDKVKLVYRTTEALPGDPWDDKKDPDNVNTSYRNVPGHIWTALNRTYLTLPKIPGKYVPGGISSGLPLTRNVRKYWKKKNNEKVRALCRALFKDFDRKDAVLGKPASINGTEVPPQDRRVYECDEYPFESTMQGAWTSAERVNMRDHIQYSIRPVWWKNNGADGRDLGTFYREERVLGMDGKKRLIAPDNFFVEAIVPGHQP